MSKSKTRSNLEDWHRQDIAAEIRKRGISVAELARRNGYSNPTTFYNVFKAPYPKVERIVADFLGVPPQKIWPTRYVRHTRTECSTTPSSAQQSAVA
ncbi:MAG: helix-turn-helix transcriptional regulator [Marinobacter sp.]|uniref:helix-turn-helix domain-containing protein n=1 Tax=Marinobacter sp. TaxID=50741 RepID=UPI00299DEF82|nr:helix-turn-helix transcriptional regulator [Marinobacter sp.]MDX1755852.1 helix-turn-helix transcriptional regulator [Marinobacter sp.]